MDDEATASTAHEAVVHQPSFLYFLERIFSVAALVRYRTTTSSSFRKEKGGRARIYAVQLQPASDREKGKYPFYRRNRSLSGARQQGIRK